MIQVNISSLADINIKLTKSALSLTSTTNVPPLANYSPVPSLQKLATEHSSAMSMSSGSSLLVKRAITEELKWASENLASFINAVEHHESLSAAAMSAALDGGSRSLTIAGEMFRARPAFQPGHLLFTPPALTVELSADPESLLAQFEASNDGAVGAAAQYWTSYAASMTELAATLATLAGRLTAENSGLSVAAASAMLAGLGARAGKVAESSSILAGHLGQLPAIKAMAVNQLSGIIASTAAIPKRTVREAAARAETASFLTSTYLPQLTAATPALTSLTVPHHGGLPVPTTSGVATPAPPRLAPDPRIAGGSALKAATAALTSAPGAADAAPAAASTIAEATPRGMGGPLETAAAPATGPAPVAGQGGIPSPAGHAGTPVAPGGAGSGVGFAGGASAPDSPAGVAGRGPGGALAPAGAASMTGPSGAGAGSPSASGSAAAGGRPGVSGVVGRGVSDRGGFGAVPGAGASRMTAGRVPTFAGAGAVPGGIGAATPSGAAGGVGRGGGADGVVTRGAGGAAHAAAPAGAPGATGTPSVTGIRRRPAQFEQDDNQRKLFGPKPVTVPATIGANVRR